MPPGLSDRASDPVVAYSAKHGVWLISGLAIQNGIATRLTMHRSRDGIAWSGPVEAAISQTAELAYDKQWLTCDNGTSSPYRGRCYLAYTDLQASGEVFALQRSDDGGLTWSPPVTSPIYVTGVIPVVQPNGRLVISSWSQAAQTIVAITSNDGGVTLGAPVQISDLQTRSAQPFRAPPLIAAELDRGGGILVTWQDCRFRSACTANDVVLTRSADGATWSAPQPRHVRAGTPSCRRSASSRQPGGWRSSTTRSSRTEPTSSSSTSADGVRWSAPQRLNARRMSFEWMPQTTLGRMLADYIGVTWSRGRPVAVYAHASPPRNGELRTAIYDDRTASARARYWPPATGRRGARRSSARGSSRSPTGSARRPCRGRRA